MKANDWCLIDLLVNLATLVKSDPKVPFLIAITPRCRKGTTPFTGLLHFTLDTYLIMPTVKQAASSTIFWVFGMSQFGIEPWSPGPLANMELFNSVQENELRLI